MKIAIIPARGGSKRIKNKNIADFLGKPLISYALEAAKKSGLFDMIHVSTDSDEIKYVVESLGFTVDFMRKRELADDYTGLVPVLRWVQEEYAKRGLFYEDICCLMPAAPLLEPEDLTAGFDLYNKNNRKNPLLVVAPFPVPVEWAFYRDHNTHLIARDVNSLTMRSQDIQQTFYESGPFSIHHITHLQDENLLKSVKYLSLLIDKSRAVDIDDPEDLELAKILFLGRKQLKNL